jgi:hypothetical protein
MVWSGATESIYSISSAHANDRARQADLVALSSSMLFAWSLSGFLVPGAATLLTAWFGTQAFMYVAITIAAAFSAFVAYRVAVAPRPADSSGAFAPMTAQTPLPAELAFSPDAPSDTTGS